MNDATDDAQAVSILLLGDEGVGKSTFLSYVSLNARLRRLSLLRGDDRPDSAASPPLLQDANQPFVLLLRSRTLALRLEFSDTASPENWRCLRPDMVLLCYDISHRPSLVSLQTRWLKETRMVFAHNDTLPILVLGLKRDLRREDDPNGVILPQEAYGLAQQLRADMYLECSAQDGTLMAQVLKDITARAVKTASPEGGQSDGACRVM